MITTALTAVSLADSARAQAQPAQVAQMQQRDFNIPSQSLIDALAQFGRETGMQVSADGALTRGITSPGVTGTMTPQQALSRLLSGTGITYRLTGDAAMLERAPATAGAITLDPVTVEGTRPPPSQAVIGNLPPEYAGGQVARGGQLGILGNKDMMDTPFNQTNYTSKLIEDQQARRLGDVLANDPRS
jgi:iron complex outermembrane receptor protein